MSPAPVVLSVDDAAANQYVVGRILTQAGYDVREASSGRDALRQLRAMHPKPDLVLLDVHLPDLDGFEVCRQIKADPHTADIPVLQISAHYTETQERVRGLVGGADGYIVAPVDPSELLANIQALIRIRELVQKEHRLREVLETVRIGTWDWDLRTGVISWSPNHATLFGMAGAEFDGNYETFRARIHPDDLPLLEARVNEARASRSIYECEYRIYWPDGSEHWLEGKGSFSYDVLGEPIWMTGIIADITERRAAEQALRASDERLRTALALVAHELRDPLAAIQNALYVLRQGDPEGDGNERALAMAERQLAQQARLVDDLMDVARLGRGKLTIQTERVQLSQFVVEVVGEFGHRASAAGVTLECGHIEPGLVVNAEAIRLNQVLGNLLNNALKFTPPGGRVTVTLEAGPEGTARLLVQDTGVGMEPEFLPRAFESFAQHESATGRRQSGLGLGLALTRGLVQVHGGDIVLESPGLGCGCTVRITLPLAPGEPGASEAVPLAVAAGPERRVLIIEDNRDAADSLAELLELAGHEVVVAYSGPEGVEAARSHGPDVVISDLRLPAMNGLAVAETLRQEVTIRCAHLIALSGYGRDEDLAEYRKAGFDHYFVKPVDAERLLSYLAALPRRAA